MASKVVGGVILNFVARTGKFLDGTKKASKGVKKFGQTTSLTTDIVKKYGAALIAAATTGGLAMWVKKTAQAIDSQAKFADSIGISTEALAALEHAGNLAGTSAEGIRKSMARMNRVLLDAKEGTAEAADALARIGLNANYLIKLKPEKQMETIARALFNVRNATIRAATAQEIFGRSGVEQLKLLEAMAKDGFAPMRREAELLGLALKRTDAAKVESMNDSFTRVKASLAGVGRQIVVEIAPAIQAMTDKVIAFIKTAGGIKNLFYEAQLAVLQLAETILIKLEPGIVPMLNASEKLARLGQAIKASFMLAGRVIVVGMNKAFSAINALMLGSMRLMRDALKMIKDYAVELGLTSAATSRITHAYNGLNLKIGQMADQQRAAQQQISEGWTKSALEAAKAWDEYMDSGQAAAIDMTNRVNALRDAIRGVHVQISNGLKANAGGSSGDTQADPTGAKSWMELLGLTDGGADAALMKVREWGSRMLGEVNEVNEKMRNDESNESQKRVRDAVMVGNAIVQAAKTAGGERLKNNKNFAVAEAAVNTALGITAALSTQNWAAAAATAMAGAAQIAAIMSAEPGGGGGGPSIRGGGGDDMPGRGNVADTRILQVNVQSNGGFIPVDMLGQVFSELNEGLDDGMQLRVKNVGP